MRQGSPSWRPTVAALLAVDGAAGLAAAALSGWARDGQAQAVAFLVACVTAGALSHAVTPGWVCRPGPVPLAALRERVWAAQGALGRSAVVMFVLLVLALGVSFLSVRASVVVLALAPLGFVVVAGLSPAWAEACDPWASRPSLLRAELHAAGGAVGVWAVPAALWWSGLLALPGEAGPWWPGFLLGPFCVAASAVPHTALMLRHAARAGMRPVPAPMQRVGGLCGGLVVLAAGLALTAPR